MEYGLEKLEHIDKVNPIIKEYLGSGSAGPTEDLQQHGPNQGVTGSHQGPPAYTRNFLQVPDPLIRPIQLQQTGKRAYNQLYHINLLKKWIQSVPVVSALAACNADKPESTLLRRGADLNPSQNQGLMELVDQYADVISPIQAYTLGPP